jgi:hypothetical protein
MTLKEDDCGGYNKRHLKKKESLIMHMVSASVIEAARFHLHGI